MEANIYQGQSAPPVQRANTWAARAAINGSIDPSNFTRTETKNENRSHSALASQDPDINGKKDTEVAALLSADMKDAQYYEDKLITEKNSPRYRGFVEANMEHYRSPRVGPIGLPEHKNMHRKQTLIKGQPVKPDAEAGIHNNKSELLYLGDASVVQRPKEPNHANLARQRVQQKTSTERIGMERAHNDMHGYLQKYNNEKSIRLKHKEMEKQKDMEMLKSYNPFGKPGGGAPIKTRSGQNLPHLSNDFEIRFRDHDYNKKMVEVGKRYKNDKEYQQEYKQILDHQIQERQDETINTKQSETREEIESMKYQPFGKPGCGAPRDHKDTVNHWSRLEPQNSVSVIDDRRQRLRLQAKDNLTKSQELRSQRPRHWRQRNDDVYNPWGKGYGNPRFDRQGNVDVRFGMKTHYDVFNRIPIVTTHSGQAIGGWPLPLNKEDRTQNITRQTDLISAQSTGDGLHSEGSGPPPTQALTRKGLLSRRHGENFITETFEAQPPMLNGKEAILTDRPEESIGSKKHEAHLIKVQNQSFVVPQTKTENPHTTERPSAGALKRELDDANKNLNMKVNDVYASLEKSKGDSPVSQEKRISFALSPKPKASSQDVADWMRSTCLSHPRRDPGTGLIHPTKRITSDVTRHRLDLRTPNNSQLYHDELSDQVRERKLRDELNRNNELSAERNWDTSLFKNFGKPGGGAPNTHGATRRQFSNPSLMPQEQLGSKIPSAPYGLDNINSSFGGSGHGAPHNRGAGRRAFSNAAIVPATQLGTNIPRIVGDKPTTVASLLNTENR